MSKEEDYDAMEKFMSEMDAGTWDQKIIKITGVEFYGMSHSVQIRNAADDGGIGVKYELVGEGEYPEEDGTAMTVTGVLVVDDSGWSRVLYVPADQLILKSLYYSVIIAVLSHPVVKNTRQAQTKSTSTNTNNQYMKGKTSYEKNTFCFSRSPHDRGLHGNLVLRVSGNAHCEPLGYRSQGRPSEPQPRRQDS